MRGPRWDLNGVRVEGRGTDRLSASRAGAGASRTLVMNPGFGWSVLDGTVCMARVMLDGWGGQGWLSDEFIDGMECVLVSGM